MKKIVVISIIGLLLAFMNSLSCAEANLVKYFKVLFQDIFYFVVIMSTPNILVKLTSLYLIPFFMLREFLVLTSKLSNIN